MFQRLDLSGSRQGQVTGSCEHCNELPVYVKLRQFVNAWAAISLCRGTLLHRVAFSPGFYEHWSGLCVAYSAQEYSAATKACEQHEDTLAVALAPDLGTSVYPSIARHIALLAHIAGHEGASNLGWTIACYFFSLNLALRRVRGEYSTDSKDCDVVWTSQAYSTLVGDWRTYPQSSSTLWNYSKCGVYTVESEAGC
jgi:hypothetical protein